MEISIPFKLDDFIENQEKLATKWAHQIVEGISHILHNKSNVFLYREEVEVAHDDWKEVDPYVISKVTKLFLDMGWAHIEYFPASGAFHFYASADDIPQASNVDPTSKKPFPVEYRDSFEFTQEYETVQRIITSTRWMEWLHEHGAGREANRLIGVMNDIDLRLREFDGG